MNSTENTFHSTRSLCHRFKIITNWRGNYWARAGGLLVLAGYSFLKVIEYKGDFFILLLAILLTLGAVLVWGIGAFMQVGLISDGRKIRLLKKLFNYPIQAVESSLSAFESVDLLCNNPEQENGEIEIVLSFSSGDQLKFGAELRDDEQNWIVSELLDYVDDVRNRQRHATSLLDAS